MMRKTICVLAVLFLAGCSGWGLFSGPGPKPESQPAPSSPEVSARAELKAARASFQKKLGAAVGLTLAELRKQWGEVSKPVTLNNLTVYRWFQTARVTPPPDAGEALEDESQAADTLVFSCLAMFIVNDETESVVDADSEGPCYDYRLMPSWRPVIEK